MDDLDFLNQAATADSSTSASLMVLLPDGSVIQISNINTLTLLETCPLLFHAFEFREHGAFQQASVEATSRSAIISLLRFSYTGTYLIDQDGCLDLLLPHAEAFKIAQDFDVPELQVQAYVNFTRSTEFLCCRATPPSDLCNTIEFLYNPFTSQHSQEYQSLLDTLLNYCLSVFSYQELNSREDFLRTVFENPAFHKDLCTTSMQRNFEDAGASDIMQLPVCRPTPYSQAALLKRTLGDFQYEIWQETEDPMEIHCAESNPGLRKKRKSSREAFTFVHRPKEVVAYSSSESDLESSSDDCTLVFRPKEVGKVANCPESGGEVESLIDESGYKLVNRPKPERELEPTSTPSQTSTDICKSPVVHHYSPISAKSESIDESNGLDSDEDWALL